MKINSSLCSVIVPSSASGPVECSRGCGWCRVTQIACVRGNWCYYFIFSRPGLCLGIS